MRGAVHVHAAVKGFQNVRLLRRLWHRVLDENNVQGGGSVNVRAPNGGKLPKIARYLSKYIGKGFGGTIRAFGKHRYRASDGLSAEPTSRRLSAWPDLRAVLETVLMEAGLALGGAVELEDVGAVWGCSWDHDGDPVMTTG